MLTVTKEYIDLSELQRQIGEGIDNLFPDRLWVRAEIASVQVKTGGHCYVDLCQNDGGHAVAKARAVIWRSRYPALIAYFRETSGGDLVPGSEVLVRVFLSYSGLYGLTLSIEEIEPLYSIGAAELQRRRTISALEAEGMMDAQKRLSLAAIPRRLAVISAANAAGYGDFCRHLEGNDYGFAFSVTLLPAAMQGADAPASISDAIALAESSDEDFDAVLIIRGGGSSLDLSCFDDYGLCLSIASCSIPVLTAIGHERDYHVADMVAYSHVKTPTAMADFFIDILAGEDEQVTALAHRLKLAFASRIARMEARLDLLRTRIRAADPRNVLARGYSLVTDSRGVVLKSCAGLSAGDELRILFADGSVKAEIMQDDENGKIRL